MVFIMLVLLTKNWMLQSQLGDFRSYEGQDMYTGEKIIPIKVGLSFDETFPFST